MKKIYLNNSFEYTDSFSEEFINGVGNGQKVRIPHTVKELPLNYVDAKDYQKTVAYRTVIKYNNNFKDKRVYVNFDGVAHGSVVYLNGKEICSHNCGYTAFKVEITDLIKKRADNILAIKVDSNETLNIPPFGGTIDYLTYGGIYRDVYLSLTPETFIEDVFVKTERIDKSWILDIDVEYSNIVDKQKIDIYLYDKNNVVVFESLAHPADSKLLFKLANIEAWDVDNPNLYKLVFRMNKAEIATVFGFRTVEFKEDGFYLNDKKIKLRGLNRHQSYPYVGYAMPDSMQRYDARILKEELSCNIVRTSHYPQSQAFIDECDKLGLLVFTEIPGWQHIGDEEWKNQTIRNVEDMVKQYRNHPSVILWGVRINESIDDDEFYIKTNKVAHELDNSRQTSGVRYLLGSSLLEDVYSLNDFSFAGDFSNSGLKTKKDAVNHKKSLSKGYIVSEFNGHMFPTKAYDNSSRRLEHALRHAHVLNSMYKEENIAGAIGWCMFDYNTHDQFGSGDKVCYHGVMDYFRNPKLAASVYSSQGDKDNVLDVGSSMEIGDYDGGNLGDIYAFSNADSIKLYKGEDFVKEFYPDDNYGNLPHPPFLIDDLIGDLIVKKEGCSPKTAKMIKECLLAVLKYGLYDLPFKYKIKAAWLMVFKRYSMDEVTRMYNTYIASWGKDTSSYRFEAIKNGEVVKSVSKAPSCQLKLDIKVSSTSLIEGKSYDVASLRFRVLDENGNVATYSNEILYLSALDGIEIIGSDVITLQGGMGGTYVKTNGKAKTGTLMIDNDRLKSHLVEFTIE